MNFEIVTIFPDFFSGPLDYGIVRRARESQLIRVRVHDLREFTHDRHRTVDDRPFGGGEGMVLKPEPLFEAVEALGAVGTVGTTDSIPPPVAVPDPVPDGTPHAVPASRAATLEGAASEQEPPAAASEVQASATAVVLLSASGKLFRQATARRLAKCQRVVLLCGRYEGVDERVAEHLATEELSIGDFVLSGGELAAALVVDAVTRLLPGALGNEASAVHESFCEPVADSFSPSASEPHAYAVHIPAPATTEHASRDSFLPREPAPILLDWPHYTRPADFRNWAVPEVLLSGNHQEIKRWRIRTALEKTRRNRPDLLARAHF